MSVLVSASYHLESIDGVEIEKPLPKRPHWVVQTFLTQWFGRIVTDKNYDVMSEANVICGADRLVPDVALAPMNSRYLDGDLVDPPTLAVEIISPGQTLVETIDKCNRLLRAGTQMCWIIWPEKRLAWNYSSEDLEKVTTQTGFSQNLIFGYVGDRTLNDVESLPIADIWAELDRRGLYAWSL